MSDQWSIVSAADENFQICFQDGTPLAAFQRIVNINVATQAFIHLVDAVHYDTISGTDPEAKNFLIRDVKVYLTTQRNCNFKCNSS